MKFRDIYHFIIVFIITFSFVNCGRQADIKEDKENKVIEKETIETVSSELAYEIIQAAFNALSSKLNDAIKEGGIENAIEYCSVNAIPITDSVSKYYKVEIKRISHKYRNIDNKAGKDELDIIEMYQQQIASEQPLKAHIAESNGNIFYYSPIIINNQLCLNCHGKPGIDIKNEDLIYINLIYQYDKATDFEMGQLRGLWRIKFPEEIL